MSRLVGALLAAVLLLGGLVAAYVMRDDSAASFVGAPVAEDDAAMAIEETDLAVATLYYPDQKGTLSAEERSLKLTTSVPANARLLLEAVLAGPTDETLGVPFPTGTTLGVTYLAPSSVLYVDLLSNVHTRPPVTGSLDELLSVFSLVNTVLLNIPEIEAVILLWNGQQPRTFAGHIDTSLPLRADPDLIRRGR